MKRKIVLLCVAAGHHVSWLTAMPPSMAGAWGWAALSLGLIWLAQHYPIEPERISRVFAERLKQPGRPS